MTLLPGRCREIAEREHVQWRPPGTCSTLRRLVLPQPHDLCRGVPGLRIATRSPCSSALPFGLPGMPRTGAWRTSRTSCRGSIRAISARSNWGSTRRPCPRLCGSHTHLMSASATLSATSASPTHDPGDLAPRPVLIPRSVVPSVPSVPHNRCRGLMPRHQGGEARKARRLWKDALPFTLARVRHRLAVAADVGLLDAVLTAEVEHHFGPPADTAGTRRWNPDLFGPEQWFEARLTGLADSTEAREALATALHAEMQARAARGGGQPPWGLLNWPQSKFKSRRGAPPRRRPDSE